MSHSKAFHTITEGGKVPRKMKKALLGTRVNKNKLRKKISLLKLLDTADSMYDEPTFNMDAFCPKCGCKCMHGTGNMAYEYPQHYENFYCLRCNHHVAYVDNSPFTHCLEFEGQEFD